MKLSKLIDAWKACFPLSEENIETPKTPTKRVRKPKKTGLISANILSEIITKSLDEDQAEDIIAIDLAGKSSIADIMIVASGRSGRHVSALADHIISKLKDAGAGKIKVEGLTNADWVLIDAGDVIAHLFKPEVRQFYAIERIWTGESKHLLGNA